jgi:cytidylate kinase
MVAKRLGFRHIDSGALYRAVTAACLRRGDSVDGWTESDVYAETSKITLEPDRIGFAPRISGEDVREEIRNAAVTAAVSRVARMPAVRGWVNRCIQDVANAHDIVAEGRDMATAVFPQAALKIFLVADPWERARRRLRQRGIPTTEEALANETRELVARDARDAAQSTPAPDAVLIDTTHTTQVEQVERIVALARAIRDGRPS